MLFDRCSVVALSVVVVVFVVVAVVCVHFYQCCARTSIRAVPTMGNTRNIVALYPNYKLSVCFHSLVYNHHDDDKIASVCCFTLFQDFRFVFSFFLSIIFHLSLFVYRSLALVCHSCASRSKREVDSSCSRSGREKCVLSAKRCATRKQCKAQPMLQRFVKAHQDGVDQQRRETSSTFTKTIPTKNIVMLLFFSFVSTK